jgi:hypothetical protein
VPVIGPAHASCGHRRFRTLQPATLHRDPTASITGNASGRSAKAFVAPARRALTPASGSRSRSPWPSPGSDDLLKALASYRAVVELTETDDPQYEARRQNFRRAPQLIDELRGRQADSALTVTGISPIGRRKLSIVAAKQDQRSDRLVRGCSIGVRVPATLGGLHVGNLDFGPEGLAGRVTTIRDGGRDLRILHGLRLDSRATMQTEVLYLQ